MRSVGSEMAGCDKWASKDDEDTAAVVMGWELGGEMMIGLPPVNHRHDVNLKYE